MRVRSLNRTPQQQPYILRKMNVTIQASAIQLLGEAGLIAGDLTVALQYGGGGGGHNTK